MFTKKRISFHLAIQVRKKLHAERQWLDQHTLVTSLTHLTFSLKKEWNHSSSETDKPFYCLGSAQVLFTSRKDAKYGFLDRTLVEKNTVHAISLNVSTEYREPQ